MLVRINLEGGIVFQIGPKMSQFLVENCNSFIHAWSKIDFKKCPKGSKNGPKMLQKWSKNYLWIDIFWDFQTMWKGLRAELQAPPVVYNILNDQKGMTWHQPKLSKMPHAIMGNPLKTLS